MACDKCAPEVHTSDLDTASRALLLSPAGPHAGRALTVRPTAAELLIPPAQFRVLLLRRLRLCHNVRLSDMNGISCFKTFVGGNDMRTGNLKPKMRRKHCFRISCPSWTTCERCFSDLFCIVNARFALNGLPTGFQA